jgi:hypothetical protein
MEALNGSLDCADIKKRKPIKIGGEKERPIKIER